MCFPDSQLSLWYEPPCLVIWDLRTEVGAALPRFFVGQRVRLRSPRSRYHGHVGLIQLHFLADNTKLTVRFPDGHEEYVQDSSLSVVTSIA